MFLLMRVKTWSVLALLVALGLAAACSGQALTLSPTAPAGTSSLAAATPSPSPTVSTPTPTRSALFTRSTPVKATSTHACPEGVVMVSVHDWSSMDQEESWQQVIQEFEAANPCIQVRPVRLPDDREARLLEIASGDAPDLVGVDSSDLARSVALAV